MVGSAEFSWEARELQGEVVSLSESGVDSFVGAANVSYARADSMRGMVGSFIVATVDVDKVF